MWVRISILVALVLMWWCGGVFPASTTHLTQPSMSSYESMKGDMGLERCGMNDSYHNMELLWPCNLPVLLPIRDDKMAELPLVCFAFYDMALRWCEKEAKFEDIFKLPSTSEACVSGNGSLHFALVNSHSKYSHTRPYVSALASALENQTLCQHICYSVNGKPEALCSLVLNGNLELASSHPTSSVVEAKPKSVDVPIPAVKLPPQPPPNAKVNVTKAIQLETPQIPKVDTIKLKDEVNLPAPPKEVKNPIPVEQAVSYLPLYTKNVKAETSAVAETDTKLTSETGNQPTRENTVAKYPPQVEDKIIQSPIEQSKADDTEYFDGSEDGIDDSGGLSMINAADKSTSQSKHFSVQETQVVNKMDLIPESNLNGAYSVPFGDAEDSNFFTYFIFAIGIFILGYVVYHNKNKVLGLLVEGRRNSNTGRRRGVSSSTAYRKLDCTLEEAVSSTPPSHGPNIVY
ncbi:uncharacterized protein LOC143911397 [Arctopsyche grandis]|uniref:uncharacterized protein LOC143911397 n=1 Tax=Arctopsyche grandis TaxID=121162 RepID=UPI00406D9D36